MRVSSSPIAYLYDVQRDAAAKRRAAESQQEFDQSRLTSETASEETSFPPTEKIVEGELLGNRYNRAAEEVLQFRQANFHRADTSSSPDDYEQSLGAKARYALTQYQAHETNSAGSWGTGMSGNQLDLFV